VADYEIEKGAQRPSLAYTFTQNGTAVDLTGGTAASFYAHPAGGTADTISGTAALTQPQTTGEVVYSWGTADVATAGDFLGRFTVRFPTGGDLTSPEFEFRIRDPFAPGGAQRLGLEALVDQVRLLCDDPPGPSQEFNDTDIVAALDQGRTDEYDYEARPIPQRINGTAVWMVYPLDRQWWETGTAFTVREGAGSVTAHAYTLDGVRGVLTFGVDMRGTSIYVTGRRYDPYDAAVQLLERLLARYTRQGFDVTVDGQVFNRSQRVAAIQAQLDRLRARSLSGLRSVRVYRGDQQSLDDGRHAVRYGS
jgi:hypothetical protein